METTYDFSGKVGIITGAANGIGRETALLMARSNASLVLVDRDKENLDTIVEECSRIARVPAIGIDADMSVPEDIQGMVDTTLAQRGEINFLITSAGVIFRTPFTEIKLEEWDEIMDTNVRGLFLCNQVVVKEMIRQGGGTIVNIASVAGRSISLIGGVHYCTSKHAVIGITRHMARELCTKGIRANAFCPGATNTTMITGNLNETELEGLHGRIPLGRLAEPAEQARAIAFLVSDSASYLNGACLDSNGGSVML